MGRPRHVSAARERVTRRESGGGAGPGKRGGRRRHSGRTIRIPSPTHAMSRETAMIMIQSAIRQTLARMLVTSRRDALASSPDAMPLTSMRPNVLTSSTPPGAPARPSSKSPFDASVLSSLSPFQRKIRVVAAVSLQAATRCFLPRTVRAARCGAGCVGGWAAGVSRSRYVVGLERVSVTCPSQGAWINVKLCVKTLGLAPPPGYC